MKFHKHIMGFVGLFVVIVFSISCNKVDVSFGDTASINDPNLVYLDNYAVNIGTYKVDSIVAPGHKIFAIGHIYDSTMGIVNAGAYAQINMPATNSLLNLAQPNLPPIYDSIELIIKPVGGPSNFYGDTTRSMKINVYQLTQNMFPSTPGGFYYNTTAFNYAPNPIGTKTVNFYATADSNIHVRLSDALGQDFFTKFLNNDSRISTQDQFVNYFRGIYLTSDSSVTNSLVYFKPAYDSIFIKLNYHQNGLYPITGIINFPYDNTNQFNNITGTFTTPCTAPFKNKINQLIPSTATCNQSFLNSNLGTSIEISFPTLLELKNLHPYVRVVQALLVIKPDPKSYQFPYNLPATLNLYTTDVTNVPIGGIINANGSGLQTGSLVVDNLYNLNTYYTYDITNFVNTIMNNGALIGAGIPSALLLRSSLPNFDNSIHRLIINDQNTNNLRQVQLKLYVLGI